MKAACHPEPVITTSNGDNNGNTPKVEVQENMSESDASRPMSRLIMENVQINYENKLISKEFLVDTGATTVYISLDLARDLYGQSFPTENVERRACVVANSVEEETFVGYPVVLTLHNHEMTIVPHVLESLAYPGILGLPILVELGVWIDPGGGCLVPKPIKTAPAGNVDKSNYILHEDKWLGLVKSKSFESIPPESAVYIEGVVCNRSDVNTFGLLEPNKACTTPAGVLQAYGTVSVLNSQVHVLLLNTTRKPVDIKRGAVLAGLSSIRMEEKLRVSSISVKDNTDVDKESFFAKFRLPSLSVEEERILKQFLWKYRNVFSLSSMDIGTFKGIKHTINTGNSPPVRQTLRRHNPVTRAEMKQLVDEMLEAGVIRPSMSPWASPPVLVEKKTGGKRFAVDYRALNDCTIKDRFPLPRIADALDCFAGSSLFSTLDLTQGFWQIDLDESSIPKTAFITPQGLWEFVKMPFGLCNSPSSFQRAMSCCLAGLNWETALCFLDDVIVFSSNFKEHMQRLEGVFERFVEFGVKLKPAKCDFLKQEVAYLGHRISKEGVSTDPKKIEAVQSWPIPRNVKELRSFLGLAQYYRIFVKNFSLIAAPLFELTKEKSIITWNQKADDAFKRLKDALMNPPVLAHPDFEKPFIVDIDASSIGIGCVLSQSINGLERPICYASHKFTQTERNWHTTHREGYGVIIAIRAFKSYLYGRKFLIRTDHKALTFMYENLDDPHGKLARWRVETSGYDFKVVHRAGEKHGNADALSRIPGSCVEAAHSVKATPVSVVGLLEHLQGDKLLYILYNHVKNNPGKKIPLSAVEFESSHYIAHYNRKFREYSIRNNLLYFRDRIVVPRTALPQLLYMLHDSPISGHFGRAKTLYAVQERYFWPCLTSDVDVYIKSCIICQRRKVEANKSWKPLQPSEALDRPFMRMAMDVLTLPPSSSFTKVLVLVDYYTKWIEAFPLRDEKAETVARILFNEIYARYGPVEYLHSDRGANFLSSLVQNLSLLCGIKQTHTAAYTPKADGQVERQIRTLSDMLAKFSEENGNWYDYFYQCLLAVRTSVHATTSFTPYEVLFGRTPRLMSDLCYGHPSTVLQQHPDSLKEFGERLRKVRKVVMQNQKKASEAMKKYYDSKRNVGTGKFKAGDWVWISVPPGPKGKLERKYDGPFLLNRVGDCEQLYIYREGFADKVDPDRCKLFTGRPEYLQGPEYERSFHNAITDFSQDPPLFRRAYVHENQRNVFIPSAKNVTNKVNDSVESTPIAQSDRPGIVVDSSADNSDDVVVQPIENYSNSASGEIVSTAPPVQEQPISQPVVEHQVSQPGDQNSLPEPVTTRFPRRERRPRNRLTYDENFEQVNVLKETKYSLYLMSPLKNLGVMVSNTCDGNGVVVSSMKDHYFAHRKSLCCLGDRITHINDIPVNSIKDFVNVLKGIKGYFKMSLLRKDDSEESVLTLKPENFLEMIRDNKIKQYVLRVQ